MMHKFSFKNIPKSCRTDSDCDFLFSVNSSVHTRSLNNDFYVSYLSFILLIDP